MIYIDGSYGEGGGQIIRTALALSLVTQKPFTIENIRAKRRKPGLMRQHLTALRAAAAVGKADVRGMALGSTNVTFTPHTIKGGVHQFSIGTAGSCTLVLQTVLPALMMAHESSEIILEGGTHNPFAPPFDFLVNAFLMQLNKMGPKIHATLEKPGFYPAGGGRIHVRITPSKSMSIIDLTNRGPLIKRKATACVANLPLSIAHRELSIIQGKLSVGDDDIHAVSLENASGPGNVISLEIQSQNITEVFTGFGERGVSAERVAKKCVKEAREYLSSSATVGLHLADQLLIPMALAGGGVFSTLTPTGHTLTNRDIIKQFLDIQIHIDTPDSETEPTIITITKKEDNHEMG